jgi:hypothetical protein
MHCNNYLDVYEGLFSDLYTIVPDYLQVLVHVHEF